MKKVILIIGIVIFFINCSEKKINFNKLENRYGMYYKINKQEPFTGKSRGYYESGQLLAEGTFKKGKLEEPYKSYYANGQIKEEETLKMGN